MAHGSPWAVFFGSTSDELSLAPRRQSRVLVRLDGFGRKVNHC